MKDDVLTLAAYLLAWLFLHLAQGGEGMRALSERLASARAGAATTLGALLHMRRDPCVRVAFTGLLMVTVLWSALAHRLGWRTVVGLLENQAPQVPAAPRAEPAPKDPPVRWAK
jgi:hypothetical protein